MGTGEFNAVGTPAMNNIASGSGEEEEVLLAALSFCLEIELWRYYQMTQADAPESNDIHFSDVNNIFINKHELFLQKPCQ